MGVLPRSTASALVMLMLSSILAGCLLGGVADGGPDADDLDIGIDVLSGGVFQGVSLKAGADLSVYIPYLVLDPMTGFVQNSTIIDIRRGESVQISILPPPRNDEAFLLIAEHGRKLWPVRDSNESWSTWALRGGQRDSANSITKVAGESEGMLSTVNASSDAAAVVNYARIPVVRSMAGAFSEDEGGLYSTGVVNGREVYDTLAKITDTDPSLTDIYDGAQGYLDRWAGQGNSAYEDAAQFLIAELSSYGLEVISHRFEFTDIFGMQNPEAYNICGYRYGELYPDEWLVFGAHFDMAPPANAVLLDPHDTGSRTYGTRVGAYDNTAGTSMVLTAAKSMSEFKSRRTMVYCLWSGEEGGKRGSDYWTEYYVKGDNPEVTVTNYINLDMGGVNWPGGGGAPHGDPDPQPDENGYPKDSEVWPMRIYIGPSLDHADLDQGEMVRLNEWIGSDALGVEQQQGVLVASNHSEDTWKYEVWVEQGRPEIAIYEDTTARSDHASFQDNLGTITVGYGGLVDGYWCYHQTCDTLEEMVEWMDTSTKEYGDSKSGVENLVNSLDLITWYATYSFFHLDQEPILNQL